ncbi:MAG: N-acetylmuramate alpha-1-phosphate uridylyltransferase MurU [Halioglobus sp.]
MKAMILAAGVGERMRPLTDTTPKPLLEVAGLPLIEHHLVRLKKAGCKQAVINVSHLGEQIEQFCGGGERWGISIDFSREPEPLETAGGILQALPLLGDEPFLIVNGDVWTDVPFAALLRYSLKDNESAHLVFVDNPPQHPLGDFKLTSSGYVEVLEAGQRGVTYAGVGIYSAPFFAGSQPGKLALRPLLDAAILQGTLGGRLHDGAWEDVGTPDRLAQLNEQLEAANEVVGN